MPKYMNANLSFNNSQIEGLKNLPLKMSLKIATKAHRPALQYKRENTCPSVLNF